MTRHEHMDREAQALGRLAGPAVRAFAGLHQATMKDGELSVAVKELMALSISAVVGCEDCCTHHLEACRRAGASDGAIGEALSVAITMGGGPAYTQAGKVAVQLDGEAG